MGYKVQFESGHTIEFDSQPSQEDIEEAYAHVSKTSVKSGAASIPDTAPESFYSNPEKDETWVDKYLRGPVEAGAQLATGAVSGAIAPVVGMLSGGSVKDKDRAAGKVMEDFTYAPRGTAGQRYGEAIGKVINDIGLPMAGIHGTLPSIRVREGVDAARSKMNKKQTSTPTADLIKHLETPVPEVPAAPVVDTKTSMQKSKTAYEQVLRERELARQSAFHRTDELGNLEQQSPMARMASELGADSQVVPEAPVARSNGPMGAMADSLTGERSSPEARAAQDALDARQRALENDVANSSFDSMRQTLLEKNAAERARQENAPTRSADQLQLEAQAAEQQAARATHEQRVAGLNEQIKAAQERAAKLIKNSKAEKEAQRVITERQAALEQEVKRQTVLEQRAAERARQEQASTMSPEHQAMLDAQEQQRLAQESEKMQNMHQMEIDDTPHVLPDSGELYGAQYGVENGLGRVDENGMPIRADRSMEAQNLENPLQRNLWGDELPRQSNQEAVRGITRAMDITSEGPMKDAQRSALGAPLGSKALAALRKKQGGAINPDVFLGKFPEFAASKMKDAYGKLKLFYHGTSKDKAFTEIKAGPRGAWFTDDPVGASDYAKENDSKGLKYNLETRRHDDVNNNPHVHQVYLNISNPYYLSEADKAGYKTNSNYSAYQKQLTAKAKAMGHDGIDWGKGVVTAFDSSQIKSAISPENSKPVKTPFNFKKQGGGVKIDWSDRKKADVLKKVPGLKDALTDVGDALIESPEQAVSLAKDVADVQQNVVQRAFNNLTKGGVYLKGRVDHPVFHYTVDRLLQASNQARGEISQKLNGVYLRDLRDLSKQEYQDAFTILNAADLNKRELTPALLDQFGVSPKVRDFITTHQSVMNDVLGKINAAREAGGKKPIAAREAYSAMSMSGDYRKVAYKTVDGEKKVVGVIGANREKGKLGWTLEKIEKEMLKRDPSIEFGPLQDTKSGRGGSRGTPHQAFQDALQILGEDNPHIKEFLDTLRDVAKDDPNNYMGMQTHTMQKKGVWGMEGRKPWMSEKENATQFFENQVRYIEGAYEWGHLAEAARDVNKVLTDDHVATKQPAVTQLSETYLQNALGINPSGMGRALETFTNELGKSTGTGPSTVRNVIGNMKGAANTWMLSLNPSFLAIQLVQAPVAIPAMAAFLRGRGLAPASTWVTQGLSHVSEASYTLAKAILNPDSLSAVDKGALKYAEKNHIYASDMVDHTSSTKKDFNYYKSKVVHSPAAKIETGTRALTYMTFVKMMNEAGLKVSDGLYEQAHRITDEVMNNYTSMEKPPMYSALGPIGSMAYNLKSFGHNELSRWSMYARELANTGNPAPLLTQMASTIAVAGVLGLPFYSQWESLYDFITGKLGSPRSLTLDVIKMSEELAKEYGPEWDNTKNTLSHGLATLAGADISRRVGMGDVLPSNASDLAFPGGGKLAEVVSRTAGAVMNPDIPHLKAAAVSVLPNVLASPLKEAWYTDDNFAYSTDPDKPKRVTAVLNGRDKLLKSVGISGINESVQKERNYRLPQLDKTIQGYRDRAIVKITHAISESGTIPEELLQQYFNEGEGDAATFEAQVNAAITNMSIDPNKLAILQQSLSNSPTVQRSLVRRMENQ